MPSAPRPLSSSRPARPSLPTPTRRGVRARGLASAALASATAFALAIACGGGGDGASPDDPTATPAPEPLFRALEADLVATCGGKNGQCHVKGSYQEAPAWLAGPDPYVSARRYPGVLPATRDVNDSILLTQVAHAGPALATHEALYRRVLDWLSAEVPGPVLPTSGAFSVQSGFNAVDLSAIAEGMTGARLEMLATERSAGVLELTALRLHAPPNAGIRVTSPFFVLLPRSGKVKANPKVDGFEGPLDVPPGATVPFYTGAMTLLRWDPAGRLKVVFGSLETYAGAGAARGCTALDVFQARAVPALQSQVTVIAVEQEDAGVPPGTELGRGSCLGCHGGGNEIARGAMDLSQLATDPAAACAQARNWIDFAARERSVLLLNPLGEANPQHPVKPLTRTDPILEGLAAWIAAETP